MSIFSIRTHPPVAGSAPAFRPRTNAPARPADRPGPAVRPVARPIGRSSRRDRRFDSIFFLLFGVVGATGALAMIAVTSYHFIQPILTMLDGN